MDFGKTKQIDIDDVIFVHHVTSKLLSERSTSGTVERRFLVILEQKIASFLVDCYIDRTEEDRTERAVIEVI